MVYFRRIKKDCAELKLSGMISAGERVIPNSSLISAMMEMDSEQERSYGLLSWRTMSKYLSGAADKCVKERGKSYDRVSMAPAL